MTEFLGRHIWKLEGRGFEGILEWLREYQRLKHPERLS
jgi:hypothetical protein